MLVMFVCLKLCPVDYVRRVFWFLLVMSLQDTFAILSYVAALVHHVVSPSMMYLFSAMVR